MKIFRGVFGHHFVYDCWNPYAQAQTLGHRQSRKMSVHRVQRYLATWGRDAYVDWDTSNSVPHKQPCPCSFVSGLDVKAVSLPEGLCAWVKHPPGDSIELDSQWWRSLPLLLCFWQQAQADSSGLGTKTHKESTVDMQMTNANLSESSCLPCG